MGCYRAPYEVPTPASGSPRVVTIAHAIKVARQLLDDAPALMSTIGAELCYVLAGMRGRAFNS